MKYNDKLGMVFQGCCFKRLYQLIWMPFYTIDYVMAYDEYLADRIRQNFKEKSIVVEEKKMMGGLCFMVDDKMCCGLLSNKNSGEPILMARIGIENYERALKKEHCSEMNFTGRSMKGFVFVSADGLDLEDDLKYWIQLCLDFNPSAKSSKKKAKRK
jgi:hypothetical protein